MFNQEAKIYVAGHTGLLGSALLRKLQENNYTNILTSTSQDLDLTNKQAVEEFFKQHRPEYIFLCAAKVGGIIGNKTEPATYLHTNITIQDNIFEMAVKHDVKQVVFYGSSCTYPKHSTQPMKEEYWLTGPIEETSAGYAAAKIAGMFACKAYNNQYNNKRFICLLPNSMYGPFDNFDLENSHVFSALIRRFYEAKKEGKREVILWGSGTPRREFIFSEDIADASIFAVKNVKLLENKHYNIGVGIDYSIKELAEYIAQVIGFEGSILWDTSKPDGTPRKLLDSKNFLALGWKPETSFEEGLKKTIKWFEEHYDGL